LTQVIGAYNQNGLILASDSRATTFDEEGQSRHFTVSKLFPLGNHAAVVSGGAGVSIPLSLALRHEVDERHLSDVDDIVAFAGPFLSCGYGRYLEEHGPEQEELRRLNFILAGCSLKARSPLYRLYLLESENNVLPLRIFPLASLIVMPRNLGMEMRLMKALQQGDSLPQLLDLSREFLEKMAALRDGVGPPFVFATITPQGYRQVIL
jgi:hypothetical protein